MPNEHEIKSEKILVKDIFSTLWFRVAVAVLGGQRAGYGEEIVSTFSKQLTTEFGKGFSKPNPKIVSALSTQLSRAHFVDLQPLIVLERWLHEAVQLARTRLTLAKKEDTQNKARPKK